MNGKSTNQSSLEEKEVYSTKKVSLKREKEKLSKKATDRKIAIHIAITDSRSLIANVSSNKSIKRNFESIWKKETISLILSYMDLSDNLILLKLKNKKIFIQILSTLNTNNYYKYSSKELCYDLKVNNKLQIGKILKNNVSLKKCCVCEKIVLDCGNCYRNCSLKCGKDYYCNGCYKYSTEGEHGFNTDHKYKQLCPYCYKCQKCIGFMFCSCCNYGFCIEHFENKFFNCGKCHEWYCNDSCCRCHTCGPAI
jgi:hypothetical protein